MTNDELRKILEEEWHKRKPRIPMGERRLELCVSAMQRAYQLGRASRVITVKQD